jgi:beta-lactamase regulating signal transducer with metallopeptidase domain
VTPLGLAIKGTAVLLAAALAARALGRAPAAWRHGAWTVAFGALVALPALAVLGPSWRVAVLPAATGVAGAPSAPGSLLVWASGVWAAGALLVAGRWIVAHIAARRLVRRAVPVAGARWRRAEAHARRALGLPLPVRLLRSGRLDTPAAWGVRPSQRTVLLPRSAHAWDDGRRRAVLLHEMAHLQRGDLWTQIVAQAAVAVHWFNPLVWRAYRTALAERELACDDAALRAGADAADYAGHLLALARTLRREHAARPYPALAAMAARPALETRIVSILAPGRRRGPASRATTLATATAGFALAVSVAALEPVAREAPPAPEAAAVTQTLPRARIPEPASIAGVQPVAVERAAPASDAVAALPPARPAVHSAAPAVAPAVPAPRAATPLQAAVPPVAAATSAAPFRPLAFKTVDPDAILRQVAQLRATVAALHDLDPEALSTEAVGEALAAVPDLTAADRAALHAEALADLSSATAAAERRLWEAETAFERDLRGGRGARGPSL